MRPSRIRIQVAAGLGTDALLADDLESASEVSSPAVSQIHALLANNVESASQVSSPAIAQINSLLGNDIESASEVSGPALAESHGLAANDVESASEVSIPSISQISVLLADNVESTSELSIPSLTQVHAISVVSLESASEVSSPVLVEAGHVLLANDIESGSEVSTPALAQIHALLAEDVESATELSTPVLAELGGTYGDVYNAVEAFPTSSAVTISLYDPITGATISLDDSNCNEIPTGMFIWDTTKLTSQPSGYQEYVWKMTDGITVKAGIINMFDQADSAKLDILITQIEEMHRIRGLDAANPVTITPTTERAGSISLTITGDGQTTSTATRT